MSPDGHLEGLPARILEFGEELRREGVAVGTSEMLDAFEVLREISWTSQEDFRESLAATLAKSQEDRRVFELLFDRFFFRAVELAAAREGVREGELSDVGELSDTELEALRARSPRPFATGPRERCATSRGWRSPPSPAGRRAPA